MSHGGRAEGVDFLRLAIAKLEAGQGAGGGAGGGAAARAPARLNAAAPLPLDLALGGLCAEALHDIVPAAPWDGAAACGFALALALRFCGDDRPLVWIIEDFAAAETGAPYGPGLAAFGLDPARLVLVRAARGPQMLWAMEEALKCAALGAVIGELWSGPRHYSLTASRRLALAAKASSNESCGPAGLVVHAGAAGQGAAMTGAAAVRFEIAARASAHEPAAGAAARALPGPPSFSVRVLRAKNAPGIDAARIFHLAWNKHERHFSDADETHPLALAADARDRPGAAA